MKKFPTFVAFPTLYRAWRLIFTNELVTTATTPIGQQNSGVIFFSILICLKFDLIILCFFDGIFCRNHRQSMANLQCGACLI